MADRRSVTFDFPRHRVLRLPARDEVVYGATVSSRLGPGASDLLVPEVGSLPTGSTVALERLMVGAGMAQPPLVSIYTPGEDLEVPLVLVRKQSDGTAIAIRTDTGATIDGPDAHPHQNVIQNAIRWVQVNAPGNAIELISDDGNEFTVNGSITAHDVGVSGSGIGGDGGFVLRGAGGLPAAVPAMQGTSTTYGPFIRWTGGASSVPILLLPDCHHVRIESVGFHGNNQTTRIVKGGGQYLTFHKCWIGAPASGGRCLWITGTTDTGYDAVAPQVQFCEIYGGGNNSWGIYIDDDTGGAEPTDGVITNTLVKGAEAGWVYTSAGGLIINGCHMTGNVSNVQGLYFVGGGPHKVHNCYLDTVRSGPTVEFAGGASLGNITNNHFQNQKSVQNTPHILMGSGSWAIIANNTWGGSGTYVPDYFVKWAGAAKGAVLGNVGNDAYIGSISNVTSGSGQYTYANNIAF